MARPLRIEYPGAWYHVTCRGNERRAIFRDERDRERFLGVLDETRELFAVEVHGYVLMENHVHLILMTPGGNLQKFMLTQDRARLAARMEKDPRLKEDFERLRDAFRQNPRLE